MVFGVAADEVPLAGMPLAQEDLREAVKGCGNPDDRVLRVVRAMRTKPNESVRWHAGEVGLSERQLRRRFAVAVGLGPKVYLRMVRLHAAMAIARRQSRPEWADIAVRCGFYDQPHMLAEFNRAVGMSCGRFLQSERAAA
ncbi:helix-turn-helix transcriptional regulator [Actinocrispum wychmicini]|uniref:AraC-like DNA-binding protein n=1 Tax=Actinocrispum wychmicini TaxID=1213861 RepID=A0A4R2JE88_9PSEU|nr:helix-turn-helix transcriptional regulator [Actinocrispum wychmicini]TCO56837.1 AraC-like DNA-binding protein [Actinocrispum wychmicini]